MLVSHFLTKSFPAGHPNPNHLRFGPAPRPLDSYDELLITTKRFDWHMPGGDFKYVVCSPRTLGKWSNLAIVFFEWVGSTTNRYDWHIQKKKMLEPMDRKGEPPPDLRGKIASWVTVWDSPRGKSWPQKIRQKRCWSKGWNFKDFLCSPRKLGKKFAHFDWAYVSDGLVQPTPSDAWSNAWSIINCHRFARNFELWITCYQKKQT